MGGNGPQPGDVSVQAALMRQGEVGVIGGPFCLYLASLKTCPKLHLDFIQKITGVRALLHE